MKIILYPKKKRKKKLFIKLKYYAKILSQMDKNRKSVDEKNVYERQKLKYICK